MSAAVLAEPWRIHKPFDGLIWTTTIRKKPTARLAIVKRAVGGKFARFRKGERVIAVRSNRSYAIERVRWRGSIVPIANICHGIPASALQFL